MLNIKVINVIDREPIVQRRLNVLVDSDLHRQLRHESVAAGVPMAVVIETALTEHFNTQLTFGDKNHGRD